MTESERISKLESLLEEMVEGAHRRDKKPGEPFTNPRRAHSELVEDLIANGIKVPEKWIRDLRRLREHQEKYARWWAYGR